MKTLCEKKCGLKESRILHSISNQSSSQIKTQVKSNLKLIQSYSSLLQIIYFVDSLSFWQVGKNLSTYFIHFIHFSSRTLCHFFNFSHLSDFHLLWLRMVLVIFIHLVWTLTHHVTNACVQVTVPKHVPFYVYQEWWQFWNHYLVHV